MRGSRSVVKQLSAFDNGYTQKGEEPTGWQEAGAAKRKGQKKKVQCGLPPWPPVHYRVGVRTRGRLVQALINYADLFDEAVVAACARQQEYGSLVPSNRWVSVLQVGCRYRYSVSYRVKGI